MFKRAKSIVAVAAMAGGMLLATAMPASAAGATLTPPTQSKARGATATWGGAWSGGAPYKVVFAYGDGASLTVESTTSTSKGYSHVFYPCTSTSYTQRLTITANGGGGNQATAGATTKVSGGGAC